MSRPSHVGTPRAFRSCRRRHIDLERVAGALCPERPTAR
ncbi:putative leader peptide [Actinacidiphila epipremni]|nr:putative leader peptide [Actinacidiphila epipremni]